MHLRLLLSFILAAGLATAAFADEEEDRTSGWKPTWTAWAPRDKVRAAFPRGATESGRAILDCVIASDGKLVDCSVARETPAGQGFGQAALGLVKYERVKTKDETGAATAGRRVRTSFSILAPGDDEPNWVRRPTPGDLAAVFPIKAMEAGRGGRAVIGCKVTIEGFLEACKVRSESPAGLDFGAAALQLAPQLRMTPRIRGGKPVAGGEVSIPIIWSGAPSISNMGSSVILDPPWVQAPTQAEINAVWPKEAAGLSSGQAALRCEIDTSGQLRSCGVISESPGGKGFGRAAKTLSKSFRVVLNPNDPKAARKYVVDVPFRFRDPATPDNRKLTKPRWIRTLSTEGMAEVYPQAAIKAGVKAGQGAITCTVTAVGELSDCKAVRESPAGLDFGAAAIKASTAMRMNPWTKEGDTVDGLVITLPIAFTWDDAAPAAAAAPKQGG